MNQIEINKSIICGMLKDCGFGYIVPWLEESGYFMAPAAASHHGAYEGGLAAHSLEVTRQLMKITNNMNLIWERKESPILVGLLHDVCKIDQYEKQEDGTYKYRKDTLFNGHGDKSVMIIGQHLKLTDEEAAAIRYHMGAFVEKEEWSYYSNAIHKYPNVLWTHTADMVASQISGI